MSDKAILRITRVSSSQDETRGHLQTIQHFKQLLTSFQELAGIQRNTDLCL